MDLKSVIDRYNTGNADLTDIALVMLEECGMSDPVQFKMAIEIINRDCNVVNENISREVHHNAGIQSQSIL